MAIDSYIQFYNYERL
ncbi:hypothetical protein [Paenibacillus sp. FSL R7-0337]